MVEKPIDVIVKIAEYSKRGYCYINAKISDCTVNCSVNGESFTHELTGVDFNKLIHAFSLLDIEFKVS